MQRSGNLQQADVPTEDLDVPIVYYALLKTPNESRVSPLRVVYPRRLGLEEPTQLFWPFVEGFEDGHEGWWLLPGAPQMATLRAASEGKSGRTALQISLPDGAKPIRLATTRVRGWQLLQEGATGLRFWVRTVSASETGTIRASLQARSSTTSQVAGTWPKDFAVTHDWRRVDITFAQLPILPWRSVDLFIIEFQSPHAADFLLDDLQMLGPWKLHPE
jgi:hypothetical protein